MSLKEIKQKIKETDNRLKYIEKKQEENEIFDLTTKGEIQLEQNETTQNINQDTIKNSVDIRTKEKAYDIDLAKGYYTAKYDKSGRHTLLCEKSGMISMFDTKTEHLFFEQNLNEQIFDSMFLHNELFHAVAQKKNIFIYDNQGKEVHCLRKNRDVLKMDFLEYHFLLVSISKKGLLQYFDTSIGRMVAEIETNDIASVLKHNPQNGIMFMGSQKGTVSLWSPYEKNYLMTNLCHNSKIQCLEIDRNGNNMITVGIDNCVRVWDLRNMMEVVNEIKISTNFEHTALNQLGMLALGSKNNVVVLNDVATKKNEFNDYIYLNESIFGKIVCNLEFCNFEDILCVSHTGGLSNLIIPGSGDPNINSYEVSPFMSKKQRQELEVKKLLVKIPYEMINLKSFVEYSLEENKNI